MHMWDKEIKEHYNSGLTSPEAVAEQVIRENIEYFANSPVGDCLALRERATVLKPQTPYRQIEV